MNRSDVEVARELALRFVHASNELLELKADTYDTDKRERVQVEWRSTWQVSGKVSGHHRRLSLELTRALARMRNR